MPRVAAGVGTRVRLKRWALPAVAAAHSVADLDQADLWTVTLVDDGRGRDALWLRRERDGQQILVWRGQVSPLPLCTYCGDEGHTNSSGTAKNCATRRAEMEESRAKASLRMKEHWRLKKLGQLAAPVLEAESPEQESPF